MIEENKGVFGDIDGGDSHRLWSTGEGGRIGYGDDQKSGEREVGNILVGRTGNVGYIVQQDAFNKWERQSDDAILVAGDGGYVGQVSVAYETGGRVHLGADRMRGLR